MNRQIKHQLIPKILDKLFSNNVLVYLLSVFLLMLSLNVSATEKDEYEVSSPISGVIKQVYINTGQIIKKGDLLLEFDDTLITSNLSEAQAKIKLAKLNLAEAKKELERAEELYDRTVLSEYDLQQAKIIYTKAEVQSASAKNQLVHAQWQMKHSKLYATFNAQVSRIISYPGQYVNNQFTVQPLFIIKINALK